MEEHHMSTDENTNPARRLSRLEAVLIDDVISIVPIIMIVYDDPIVRYLGLISLISFVMIQLTLLSRTGQTIGKKIRGIMVVKTGTSENGGFITNVVLRAIPGTILSAIPIIGLVNVLFIFRKDRRCIHDLIAGTEVIEV